LTRPSSRMASPLRTEVPQPPSAPAPAAVCDKCDGPHDTDLCPAYRRPRESHTDAWVNKGHRTPKDMGGGGGDFVLRHAHIIPQPGDGSCLFHALGHGLGHTTARALRRDIAAFIERHPDLSIADSPLSDWVYWDSQCPVAVYARRMAVGGWGGGIEMAACARCYQVNVHVYERSRAGFKRISCFDVPEAQRTVHVLYAGGVHFDALVPL
jgi:hypothetical protein